MTDRSLLTVVTDGPITAPRWVHYLVKVAIGILLAAPFLLFHWHPVLAWIPGTLFILAMKKVSIYWRGFLPVAFAWWTAPIEAHDVECDLACHLALMPFVMFSRYPSPLGAVLMLGLFASIVGVWRNTYPEASP